MFSFHKVLLAVVCIVSLLLCSCDKKDVKEPNHDTPGNNTGSSQAKWYSDQIIELTPEIVNERISKEYDSHASYKGPDKNKIDYIGDRPCIIDFSSVGCEYCNMMNPILKKFAAIYAGRIYIYEFIEQNPMNTHSNMMDFFGFHVGTYPSFVFINSKGEIDRAQGYIPEAKLRKKVEAYLLETGGKYR